MLRLLTFLYKTFKQETGCTTFYQERLHFNWCQPAISMGCHSEGKSLGLGSGLGLEAPLGMVALLEWQTRIL